MKKIALVVFPIHSSHGCILQTYALKCKIEDMGFDVEIINRHWDAPSLLYRLKVFIKNLLNIAKNDYSLPLLWQDPCDSFKLEELNVFIKKYLSHQVIDVRGESALRKIDWDQYYALVVGSDQTWRPKYVSNVFNYYLNFAENFSRPLKISYAASFGTDKWEYNPYQTTEAQRLLSKFDSVSVREVSGTILCKNFLKKEAFSVVDPTLLYSGKEYITRLELNVTSNNTIATYFLDKTEKKSYISRTIASEFNCNIIDVNRDIENPKATRRMQIAPSMKEWLESSISSRYVIVDSFHAMVFAILFHKQFLVIGNTERGLSRFLNILEALGLSERLYSEGIDVISQISKPINWDYVEDRLSELRQSSIDYLNNTLNKNNAL